MAKAKFAGTIAGGVARSKPWQFLHQNPPPHTAKTKRAVAAARHTPSKVTLSNPPWGEQKRKQGEE